MKPWQPLHCAGLFARGSKEQEAVELWDKSVAASWGRMCVCVVFFSG